MPKRGLLSWLREWAEGDDPISAANAFKVVVRYHGKIEDIDQAKVIPTTDGLRALADKDVVFLSQETDIEIEGATFVDPDFLARPGVEELLRKAGFRDLDPLAVLNARLAKLSLEGTDEELTKLWDAVMDVPVPAAARALGAHAVKVRGADRRRRVEPCRDRYSTSRSHSARPSHRGCSTDQGACRTSPTSSASSADRSRTSPLRTSRRSTATGNGC